MLGLYLSTYTLGSRSLNARGALLYDVISQCTGRATFIEIFGGTCLREWRENKLPSSSRRIVIGVPFCAYGLQSDNLWPFVIPFINDDGYIKIPELHMLPCPCVERRKKYHLMISYNTTCRILLDEWPLIGASLSEPHIVVIPITFSCPTYICLVRGLYRPIAYNRISTWKTRKLRARAPDTIFIHIRYPRRATCARPRSGRPTS